MRNGNAYFFAVDVDFRFFDTVEAANRRILDIFHFLASEPFIRGAQCSFHNAARCAEDGSSTCCFTHRIVKFAFRQVVEINTDVFDKFD